jgi:hypothetical protein
MLAKAPPNFFKDKLQPFVHSFLSRNISTSESRGQDTKRDRMADKVEKHLGLIFSSSIRVAENGGQEQVVRVGERDPEASISRPSGAPSRSLPALPPGAKEAAFQVNIVTVRTLLVKGRIRNSTREEFIVKTSLKGQRDVYVSRRYGDFARLAQQASLLLSPSVLAHPRQQLRKDFPEEDVRPPPGKDRRAVAGKGAASPDKMPSSPVQSFDSDNHAPYSSDQPMTLARERNRLTLRAYIRHLLNQPAIASSDTLRTFLLDQPTHLSEQELHDIAARDEMDRAREAEVAKFKSEVEGRVKDLEVHLRAFKDELVKQDGLTRVFATIRQTPNVRDLPVEYQKLIEWARISCAAVPEALDGVDHA